jgi:hypothetical protein
MIAWNADRFSGRNFALRLVALRYTNITWYRGDREAWEIAGLPETEVPFRCDKMEMTSFRDHET